MEEPEKVIILLALSSLIENCLNLLSESSVGEDKENLEYILKSSLELYDRYSEELISNETSINRPSW